MQQKEVTPGSAQVLDVSGLASGQSLACGAGFLGRCCGGLACPRAAHMLTRSIALEGTCLVGAPWAHASSVPAHSIVSWRPICLVALAGTHATMHLGWQKLMHATAAGCSAVAGAAPPARTCLHLWCHPHKRRAGYASACTAAANRPACGATCCPLAKPSCHVEWAIGISATCISHVLSSRFMSAQSDPDSATASPSTRRTVLVVSSTTICGQRYV